MTRQPKHLIEGREKRNGTNPPPVTPKPALPPPPMSSSRRCAESVNLRAWLQHIADVAYDRDGYHSAKDLGELVDELRSAALQALSGTPYRCLTA